MDTKSFHLARQHTPEGLLKGGSPEGEFHEISERQSFSSPSAFVQFFKKHTGTAPKIFFRYYFVNSQTGEKSGTMLAECKWEPPEVVAAPEISGTTPFSESTEVSISGPNGAEIRYTTDGSNPTAESTLYSAAFSLSATATVKAIAIKNGVSSEVASKTFTKSE
ncbi:MAG: chitobiase/beta-hexosaminidase C-terminal domain-containing protein [Bacteroidales bacterium]|nr:chitobiase/beta-hexosaminidase C-terminal domain-containing protein [Bacteroidales bacterium]